MGGGVPHPAMVKKGRAAGDPPFGVVPENASSGLKKTPPLIEISRLCGTLLGNRSSNKSYRMKGRIQGPLGGKRVGTRKPLLPPTDPFVELLKALFLSFWLCCCSLFCVSDLAPEIRRGENRMRIGKKNMREMEDHPRLENQCLLQYTTRILQEEVDSNGNGFGGSHQRGSQGHKGSHPLWDPNPEGISSTPL